MMRHYIPAALLLAGSLAASVTHAGEVSEAEAIEQILKENPGIVKSILKGYGSYFSYLEKAATTSGESLKTEVSSRSNAVSDAASASSLKSSHLKPSGGLKEVHLDGHSPLPSRRATPSP